MPQVTPAKDLIEFYLRWNEFRPHLVDLRDSKTLEKAEKEALDWLIMLADRISLDDLQIDSEHKMDDTQTRN